MNAITTSASAIQPGRSRNAEPAHQPCPFSRELFVDPVVQAGQRGLDDGENILEVVVVAVVGILDVEGMRTRARVE